ncbi:MAG: hypothetical protein GYB32_09635 [Algicola sp.]|nr:hypothetical protein [Algicola sp.]
MLKRTVFYLSVCFSLSFGFSQDNQRFCEQLQALQKLVTSNHYQPKVINDSLSSSVYDLFLDNLDDSNRLFMQEDIDVFESDRLQIDDYIHTNNCEFVTKYAEVLNQRIEDSKDILRALETVTFDYSGKDTLRFKKDSKWPYFRSKEAVKSYWSKRMRYNILYALVENDSVLDRLKTDFKDLEKELKPKLIQKEICQLEALQNKLGSLDAFVKESFLNAYLHYHDPNSSFFTPTEKEIFESSLSNHQFSFGITTEKNDDGDIVIVHISPGSAAFNNGEIEVNDVIKSLQTTSQTLETYCVSNEDVIDFLFDQKHNTITFKIKKKNGPVLDIELTKTETKTEDNTVSGFIIEDQSKVGYISIPSFYSDMDSPNGLGLANDVAKELYKLQKENIEGLILDLRFNGGGSMKEAADLSGMFINRGPLSILRYNNGETITIKDFNRGSLFTKPIVVLVNNYSASASEFFAASMQDYNRAVIVGATTHGKASAQVIFPLDEDETLGYSKLTVEKFYRVTGQSHQSKGVVPDIILPNLYDGFKTQEQFEAFALKNDTVGKTIKFPKLKKLPVLELKKKSFNRLVNHTPFDAIKGLNQLILNNYFNLDTEYQLTLDNVYNEMMNYRQHWSTISQPLDVHQSRFLVKNSQSTKEVMRYNEDQKRLNETILKDIKQDIYIEEAQAILQDLLKLNALN